jgi:4-carboxymuconolactone decarboxylase
MVTDAYLAGLDVLASVGADNDELRNRAAEVAPEFVRIAISFTYGEIFNRPGLDLRTRMIAAVAAAVASRGSTEALRQAVESALHLGWSQREITEAIIQTAAHAGVPVALKALTDCHDLLTSKDPCSQSCESAPSDTGQE